MRKLVIIGLVLSAIWFGLMPALVGYYLRDAAPAWLEEQRDPTAAVYQAGWFTSRLDLKPDSDTSLKLTARHFPPFKPGWVALRGQLASPFTPQGADIRAHLGLTGSWHVSAETATFKPGQQGAWATRNLKLNLAQVAGQPANLTVSADQLDLPAQSRPLEDLRGRAVRREAGEDLVRLGLDVQANDPELGPLILTLQAGPMAAQQLELLTQGLGQLAQSQSGSISEGMALMTMAGAWQQMASEGLTIELERLQFGEQTAFAGSWAVADNTPSITGSGDVNALNRWLSRLAPTMQDRTRGGPAAAVELLSEIGEVRVVDQRFRFRLPADPGAQQAP